MLSFLVCYVAAVAFPIPETSYFYEHYDKTEIEEAVSPCQTSILIKLKMPNLLGIINFPSISTEHLIVRRKTPCTSNFEVIPAPEKVSEAIIPQTEPFTSNAR